MKDQSAAIPGGLKARGMWNKYFILLLFCALVSTCTGKYYESTMSLHIEALNGPAAFTGTLMTGFTIAAAIFRIVGGNLADRIGRVKVIVIGTILFIVPCVGMAIFPNSFPMLLVFRIMQGAGFATVGAGYAVAITDVVPGRQMGEGVGYYALSSAVASAIGPVIALAVLGSFGFRGVSVTGVATLAASLLITLVFCRYEADKSFYVERDAKEEDTAEDTTVYTGIWKILEKKAVKSAILVFFVMFAGSAILSYLTLYAQRSGIGNAALFFTFSAVTMVVVRLVAGKINDKYGVLAAVLPGCVSYILGYLLLIFAAQYEILYYVSGVLYGIGNGLVQPALNAESVRGVSANRRGAAIATYNLPIEIGISIGSLLWGFMIDNFSFNAVFIWCMVSIGVTMAISVVFFAGRKREKTAA